MTDVIRTDGSREPFKRKRIVDALLKETKLCEDLFGVPGATEFQAEQIAILVENAVNSLTPQYVTSHTIREIMCSILLEQRREPFESWYSVCTRVGMSVYDAWQIDQGEGFESKTQRGRHRPSPGRPQAAVYCSIRGRDVQPEGPGNARGRGEVEVMTGGNYSPAKKTK